MKLALAAVALVLAHPCAAQITPTFADVHVSVPPSIDLPIGNSTIAARVEATLRCDAAASPPAAVQATLHGPAPDDGRGPAWRFGQQSWSLGWTASGANYTLDHRLVIPVEAFGYGAVGTTDKWRLTTATVLDTSGEACMQGGYWVSPADEGIHVTVGPRPGSGSAGSGLVIPAPGAAWLAAGLGLLALRKRKA